MTIFNTAYDTTACSGYRINDTRAKLDLALSSMTLKSVDRKLENIDESFKLAFLEGGNSTEDVIPYFYHPIFLDNGKVVVVDVRNFGKWYEPQQKFIVRNTPEYNWHCSRASLNYIWNIERVDTLRDISTLPAAVYCSLISESVSRKYALDPAEQLTVAVMAGFFYYSLFTDDKEFNEFDFNKIAGNIAKCTKVPATKVFELIENLPVINNLSELCEVIKTKTQSVRLNDFNVGVLIAIVSGNWFGTNARENLSVGLEHIPTWLMIVYAAIEEATFKRSVLAKLVDRFNKGGAGNSFTKTIDSIIDSKDLKYALNKHNNV